MATQIRHTIPKCIAELERIDAEEENVAQQPTTSRIANTTIGHARTLGDLERRRDMWLRRLRRARIRGF